MSEETLFRVLRRTPIKDMDIVYRSRFWEFYKDTDTYEKWLLDNGWNREDFIEEGNKYDIQMRKQGTIGG
jgi:hypothetical protein